MNIPVSTRQEKRIVALFPELLGIGGVQEAGRLTAAALNEIAFRQGWSVDLLSLNDSPGVNRVEANATDIRFRGFGRSKLRFVMAALSQARHTSRDTSSLVLATHPYLARPALWMQSVSPRVQTIAMAHGVEVWEPLPRLRRRALSKTNLVLCPSRDTERKLAGIQRVQPGRIKRLPWPLNPGFLRMAEKSASLPLPQGFPTGNIVLTIGRWAASERYKGMDELIGAIAQLRERIPGLQLVAVGGGDDLPRLRQLAADLGVGDRTHFLEDLSREEVGACYANASVFSLPSSGEGFGLVFLEAMAFAKPIVAAQCGGATDLVQDAVNGLLVPPNDSVRLAQVIGQLLENEALRAKLGQTGAEIVRREYRFDTFRSRLEEILMECGKSRQPAPC